MRNSRAFTASPEDRTRVELMIGAGISKENIAKVMGCSPDTLRRVFKTELETGRAHMLAETLEQLHRAASKGHVAAGRALVAILRGDPVTPNGPLPPRRRRMGQREAADIAAESAHIGTSWEALVDGLERKPKVTRARRKPKAKA